MARVYEVNGRMITEYGAWGCAGDLIIVSAAVIALVNVITDHIAEGRRSLTATHVSSATILMAENSIARGLREGCVGCRRSTPGSKGERGRDQEKKVPKNDYKNEQEGVAVEEEKD